MKFRVALILLTAIVLTSALTIRSQVPDNPNHVLEDLNAQMNHLQDKEAELRIRLDQLDVDLKPENIERYFTGYGSVHPEQLREARRRQLQMEKDRVVSQLDHIRDERMRLTLAINEAQVRALHQSGQGFAGLSPNPQHRAALLTGARMVVLLCVVIVVLASLAIFVGLRWNRNR